MAGGLLSLHSGVTSGTAQFPFYLGPDACEQGGIAAYWNPSSGSATISSSAEDEMDATERWQSGRLYLTRNQANTQVFRGFESLPLRQSMRIHAGFQPFLGIHPSSAPSIPLRCSDTT